MPRLRLVPGGINCYVDPETGKETQTHSSTCAHCQHMSEFESLKYMFHRKDPRDRRWDVVDYCRSCNKLICEGCVGKPCITAEQHCEFAETLRRKIHIAAWGCY